MAEAERLLELIEDAIVKHGGDLGGWTRRNDETLQLFDGRVSLRAEVSDEKMALAGVHAHVFTTLHEHEGEVLDACLIGFGEKRDKALAEAAMVWLMGVAGPIKSFLDGTPVCMTCQAGVAGGDASKGYVQGDYGLPGLRAYVGPAISRGFKNEKAHSVGDDTDPWFRFAAESAAPRRVHLAKAIVMFSLEDGWHRELEIDGHEVSYKNLDWPGDKETSAFGYITRFAVFEFPRNSTEIAQRAELERTLRYFAEHFASYNSVDALMKAMVDEGFDADLVHEVESISTIAFGRMLFEHRGVQYSSTVIRAATAASRLMFPSCRFRRILVPARGCAVAASDDGERLPEALPIQRGIRSAFAGNEGRGR